MEGEAMIISQPLSSATASACGETRKGKGGVGPMLGFGLSGPFASKGVKQGGW
jgi:hypothetical protein